MEITNKIVIDIEGRKSYKIWSDNLQRYYYKSKDPNYYNEYFHKNKKLMTCDICGRTVTCQMYSHKKSMKCIAAKHALEIEQLKKELHEIKGGDTVSPMQID